MTNATISSHSEEIQQVNIQDRDQDHTAVTSHIKMFYLQQAAEGKHKIDLLAADIKQRQDKMHLINDIIMEINSLTDEKNGLDISQKPDLLKKIQEAQKLGVTLIKDGQVKFNGTDRNRLVENLHTKRDMLDKDNRYQTQQMEIHVKALDRLMVLLKDVDRKEEQAKRSMLSGLKGAV